MENQEGMLEKAVEQLEKANADRDKLIALQMQTYQDLENQLKGSDKIKFQTIKTQIKNSLEMVKNGGNVEAIVESLKNIKY